MVDVLAGCQVCESKQTVKSTNTDVSVKFKLISKPVSIKMVDEFG